MILRDYQQQAINDIYSAWNSGARNVLLRLDTGSGKTVIFTKIVADFKGPAMAIAHRGEIVCQISLALCREQVPHNIIAPLKIIREIVKVHMIEIGQSFYSPQSTRCVASVDTLLRRSDIDYGKFGLIIQDEAHHVLRQNKWGKAAKLFPNALGLYPTATPLRADGHGLGRHAAGIIDTIVYGPNMRELIEMGYLTEYRIFCPRSDLDLSTVSITASGDYSLPKLRTATHKSHITGDVVENYLRIAKGKLGITFAVDLESAADITKRYKDAGVKAEIISSKTPDSLRCDIMRRFRNRQIMQLVNVDLLGEGVDVPALEVVTMARATQSYSLYSQQFGRALRPMVGKERAIIIDHVDNVLRHNLPDADRIWSLDSKERKFNSEDEVKRLPLKTCLKCFAVYPRLESNCPHCKYRNVPLKRSTPAEVDGDLCELDAEVLQALRSSVAKVYDAPRVPQNINNIAQLAVIKNHRLRKEAIIKLKDTISQWAGYHKAVKRDDSYIYKRFYHTFGIDVLSAQVLNTKDATQLQEKITKDMEIMK